MSTSSANQNIEIEKELLKIGKDMFETAVVIRESAMLNFYEAQTIITEEIINLIEAVKKYGELVVSSGLQRTKLHRILEIAKKDINICKIATPEVAYLAAKFCARSLKEITEVFGEESMITVAGAAAAWGAHTMLHKAQDDLITAIESADSIISRVKKAVELTMEMIEKKNPESVNDLEWQRVKRDLLTKMLVVEENCAYITAEDEDEEGGKNIVAQVMEIVQGKISNIMDMIRAE